MYAEEWLGHTLLRCSTSFEKGIEYERKRNLDILQGLIKFNEQQPGELRQVVVNTLEQMIPYVMGEEMSKELRDNYDLGILAGVAQERERIADKLRDQAADLIADGHMASAELVLLGKLIDWLDGEQK